MPERVCVVGAGAAGLAVAKVFKDEGLAFDVLESGRDVGGLWDIARPDPVVSPGTHTISSRALQGYPDFPMPGGYPDYPGHALVLRYLRSYADAFRLREHVSFGVDVTRIEPGGEGWRVSLSGGQTREYAAVVLATGLHRVPHLPALPGAPGVETLHSTRCRRPEQLLGKRVLVVGGGQSAADLVCESAALAARTIHSARRGFYCVPKHVLGVPTDTLQRDAPLALRRLGTRQVLGAFARASAAVGLPPSPRGELGVPVVGDALQTLYAQGDVVGKGAVSRVDGARVTFDDGSTEDVDLVVLATGFEASYGLVDRAHLDWRDGDPFPDLYLHVFPREERGLYMVGMVRPFGPHWVVHDEQAKLVAAYLAARRERPEQAAAFDRARKGPRPGLSGSLGPSLPPLTVDRFEYLRALRRHASALA